MARTSLRSLIAKAEAVAAPTARPIPIPEDVAALLRERETLERGMAALSGRSDDPRYPVTPLGDRRGADAAWARARDRMGAGRSAGSAAGPARADMPGVQAMPDPGAPEPEPRTGQRAVGPPSLRTGLRTIRNLFDTPSNGARPRELAPPELRPLDPRELPPLRNLSERVGGALTERPIRDGAMARAAERLDILRGGSGDLDALRDLASRRGAARRAETRRDESRLDRRRSAGREEAHDRRPDRDGPRDAARLERDGRRRDV